eukprot:1148472-Pelagomonas_calceolata.AAC.2
MLRDKSSPSISSRIFDGHCNGASRCHDVPKAFIPNMLMQSSMFTRMVFGNQMMEAYISSSIGTSLDDDDVNNRIPYIVPEWNSNN